MLASLATPDLRDTAKGAVQYRHLIDFVSGLRDIDQRSTLLSEMSWDEVLNSAKIIETISPQKTNALLPPRIFLVRNDGTFYILRYPVRLMENLKQDWASFQRIEVRSREAIVDALLEDHDSRNSMLRYRDQSINEFLAEREQAAQEAPLVQNLFAMNPPSTD